MAATSLPADPWTHFAFHTGAAGSKLYQHLSTRVATDPQLQALCKVLKPGQPPPNTLFAAVHYLLLRGAQHKLRDYYPTLGGMDKGDAFPVFRDFCLAHKNEIEQLVSTRVTNTNEIGRSSIINAGMRALTERAGEPLCLIEIGASAGLNMIWDKYTVHYMRNSENFIVNEGNSLAIDCELRGDKLPPLGPAPRVDKRVGIELNPVDLDNQEDSDWQCALMWPDQPERLQRIRKAIEIARQTETEILSGDAIATLPEVLSRMPDDGAIAVYHTNVFYQFTQAAKEIFENLLLERSRSRPLWRLAFEGQGDDFHLTLTRYFEGLMESWTLAQAHPHGAWIKWL